MFKIKIYYLLENKSKNISQSVYMLFQIEFISIELIPKTYFPIPCRLLHCYQYLPGSLVGPALLQIDINYYREPFGLSPEVKYFEACKKLARAIKAKRINSSKHAQLYDPCSLRIREHSLKMADSDLGPPPQPDRTSQAVSFSNISNRSKQFTVATRACVNDMYDEKCWACGTEFAQIAHVIAQEDKQVCYLHILKLLSHVHYTNCY